MGLKDRLQKDLHEAMRARDERRKAVLRMALAAIQLAEVEQKTTSLSDEDVIVILRKEARSREEALAMMREAGRDELIADEIVELEVLQSYLPSMLSEEEVAAVAREVIADIGATSPADMGRVMGALMPRLKGKADGRMVSQVVRDLLAE